MWKVIENHSVKWPTHHHGDSVCLLVFSSHSQAVTDTAVFCGGWCASTSSFPVISLGGSSACLPSPHLLPPLTSLREGSLRLPVFPFQPSKTASRVGACLPQRRRAELPRCWSDSCPTRALTPQHQPLHTHALGRCSRFVSCLSFNAEAIVQHLERTVPSSWEPGDTSQAHLGDRAWFRNEPSFRGVFVSSWFKIAKWHSVNWWLSGL